MPDKWPTQRIQKLPLIVVAVTFVLCIVVSILSLKSGHFIIFQNLFYIPIVISCFYYKKRGFIFSIIISCIYFFLIVEFTSQASIILQAAVRVCIFLLIAGIVTYLSLLQSQLKELRIVNVYTRSLIEASLDPLLVIAADGTIMDVNKATETATGCVRTELIGREFSGYFTEPEKVRAIYQDVFRARPRRNEQLGIRHRNGRVTLVLFNASLCQDEREQVVGIFAAARDITERKQAEDELKESEEKYRSLFENARDGIALADAKTGVLMDCNQALCRMVEREKTELLGQHQSILHSQQNLESGYSSTFMQHQSGKPGLALEENLLSTSGKVVPVEISAAIVRMKGQDCLFGIFRDITERKRAEKELLQAEERFRSIFENAQEGICRTTPEGGFVMANQAMAQILGYDSAEELIAMGDISHRLYVHPEDHAKDIESVERHGSTKNDGLQLYRKDGSIIWVYRTMKAIHNEKGELAYYDGLMGDITERKKSVDQLRKALGGTVQAIAALVETRDPYTAGHQRRVADLSHAIATKMHLDKEQIEAVRIAGMIHDIGKIAVPAEILSMPRRLTSLEYAFIKNHSEAGYNILKDVEFPWTIARIVLEHHERMDGSGYPKGVPGNGLLLESRILAVADTIEAMATHRPYRPAIGIAAALEEITKTGSPYDPDVVDACVALFRDNDFKLSER